MSIVAVDIRRRIGPINPHIYGNFIEHLGRCIYGGIYEPGSPLADARGFRRDVLEAVKRLRVPILRWPGGNFVSGYHWTDGIGPKETRPRRMELAWHTVETNQFGTDEFIAYCREVGTEPYICVNMGSGTMDEAAAWVEYCNGTQDTYWANKRRENGNPKPFAVKYWGLGNEVSGTWQIGHKDADTYVAEAIEFAKVMKWTDPSVKLIACGSCMTTTADMEWNRKVIEGLKPHAEYLGIHMYVSNRRHTYEQYMGTTHHIERYIRAVRGLIDAATYAAPDTFPEERRMSIAFDEWNATYSPDAQVPHERYTLEDALVVAMFLNAFLRHADAITMANMAQLVNVIPPIFTSPDDMFFQTIFYPLELYTLHNGTHALDAYVECPTVPAGEYGKVPVLDVSSSYSPETGMASVNLINRHRTEAVPLALECQHGRFNGEGTLYEITGEDVRVYNDFARKDAVTTTTRPVRGEGKVMNVALSPHSVTMVRVPVAV